MAAAPVDLKNHWVHFRIRDVYVPDPQELLAKIYGDDLLQGRVIDISDSGLDNGTFAVVEVEAVKQPVIVPVQKILGVL